MLIFYQHVVSFGELTFDKKARLNLSRSCYVESLNKQCFSVNQRTENYLQFTKLMSSLLLLFAKEAKRIDFQLNENCAQALRLSSIFK